MDSSHWIDQALELPPPWRVDRVAQDQIQHRMDVWISAHQESRGWFFRTPPAASQPERVWRHLNLGSQRCYVHLSPGEDSATTHLDCCGDAGYGPSRAMVRHVVALMGQGVRLSTLSSVLALPVEDLWQIKQALDQGRLAPPQAQAAPEAAESADCADSRLAPPPEHPVWEQLLRGRLVLDIRALPLKLMLSRLREQIAPLEDPEVLLLRIGELHRYFRCHPQSLAHELAQLNAWSAAA